MQSYLLQLGKGREHDLLAGVELHSYLVIMGAAGNLQDGTDAEFDVANLIADTVLKRRGRGV